MKNANRMMTVILGCALTMSASWVLAQDWPQWRGPNRDAKVTGFTAPKTWPQQFTQKWKIALGQGDATPALVGDKLYVFARQEGNEVTLCLDTGTGKELWRDQYNALGATGPASGHSGPRSSPAVANGKIVTLGVRGTLSCLDAATGKKLWRKDDSAGVPPFFTSSSPMIIDGFGIAQIGGRENGAMVAYDLATGDQKWKWTGDGTAYASPVLLTVGGSKLIVTQTEKNVIAVGLADGKLAWQAPFAPQGRTYNAATPIVDGQTIIYGGGGRRGTKAVKIEKEGEGFVAKELWSNADNSVQFNTPVLKNGLLFGLADNGTLFCINAQTGQTAWTAPAPIGGRAGFGSVVDAGSVLLALTPKSQLIVLQPGDKAYTELASIKVADKETYAYPVVAGNRVFVKDQDSVTLWTIE